MSRRSNQTSAIMGRRPVRREAAPVAADHLFELVNILGKVDAIFEPFRGHENNLYRNLPDAQSTYRTRGVSWASGGGSQHRKQAERSRGALEATGLVKVIRAGGRMAGVVLTKHGEAVARDAVGTDTLEMAGPILDRLLELRADADGFDFMGRAWTRETDLAETTYELTNADLAERQKLIDVECRLLPAIVAGWVVANTDIKRRVSYSLHNCTRPPSLSLQPDHRKKQWLAEPTDRLVDAYFASKRAECDRLAAAEPSNPSDCGLIALPCSPTLRKFTNPIGSVPVITIAPV